MRAPLLLALFLPATALADPIEVAPGPVVLPLTGLNVDLPKDPRPGFTWSLSASWSLTDGGGSFDARDVIDQKVNGEVVGGTWVHVGYFNAGDCAAVANELDVPDRWTAQRDLWGRTWSVAGGTWDFENALGKAPVVALCTPRTDRASLLLYQFYVGETVPVDRNARLDALAKNTLLENVTRAWEKDRSVAVLPLRRPEVKMRGEIPAVRTVRLQTAGLDLALPDDGFVWLARKPTEENPADYLDRMAPAEPDVSLELARAPGMRCDGLFAASGPEAPPWKVEPPPVNVPAGWTSLGTFELGPGALERLICRDTGGTALVVGYLESSASTGRVDLAPYGLILSALAAASDAGPKAP